MKRIILILFAAVTVGFAQNEQKSIELPDFVITGRQSVDVQTAQKKKPELISTLSEDFLTPQYSPEELDLLLTTAPVQLQPNINDFNIYSGSLFIGGGIHTLPLGKFEFSNSISNYIINAGIFGSNTSEYISNAGFNTSGITLNNYLFIDTDSEFLPGSYIKLNGSYSRSSYKFFGSVNPTSERKTNFADANFSFTNYYNRWINFGLNVNAHYLDFTESSMNEKYLSASGLLEIKFGNLSAGLNGTYSNQFLKNNLSGIDNYDFYSFESFLRLSPTKSFRFKLGVNYSAQSKNSFFTPFGSLQLLMDKHFSFLFEYKPHSEFLVVKNFLDRNLYVTNRLKDNLFSEKKSDMKALFKYQYDNYFSASVWGQYSNTENYLYFEDATLKGFFDVLVSPSVQSYSFGIDLLYNTKLFGYIIGETKYQNIHDALDRIIPYNSKYYVSFVYGYNFNFGLGFETKYIAHFDTYADLANSNKINSYHNLSAKFIYKIYNSLSVSADFHNILNRSNFVLNMYQEKPFDAILGIEYRW